MTRIRELTASDIPQVADVHREAMATGSAMTPALLEKYREWLTSVFLENPMRVDGVESLVYEDGGEILGFMGVVPRQVSLGGRVYRAAAGSNFCVRPGRRGRIGMQMAREYLARSGDLAFIDQLVDRTRPIWDHLGMVAMPQSVRWTLPLRPLQHVLSLVGPRLPAPLTAVARPVATALDRVATGVRRSPFKYDAPALAAEDLTGESLSRLLQEFGTERHLRPVTSDGSAAWLVERARRLTKHGELQLVALRDEREVLGWYVYHANPGQPSEVLQLVSTPRASSQVLDHLAGHARARGVVSLTGALDLGFLSALSNRWAVLSPAPRPTRWLLVHSGRPEILEAFWRGQVLLSRLDGEWCQQLGR